MRMRIHLHLLLWLAVLITLGTQAAPSRPTPIWTIIVGDKELFGSNPAWLKIEKLREAVEEITGNHTGWDATADISESGIELKKLITRYPIAQRTTGAVRWGAVQCTNVTFYHYGPIAFGVKDGSQAISFLTAPRYFFQKGFIATAEKQQVKPFDFTKVNGADDKDILIHQLVGSWMNAEAGQWKFEASGMLFHGGDAFFVLGNRIIRNGETQWIMVLKDTSLELWSVDYTLLSLSHKLTKMESHDAK
jgi:hypothetical protein